MTITTYTRISKKKLSQYNRTLSEREKAALQFLRKCSFLKTGQIARLYYGNTASPANLRATSRTLAKLHILELCQPLKRRIGGVRAGSSSYVWALKMAGAELLCLDKEPPPIKTRKRVFEPTYPFLNHMLAVAELYTILQTMNGVKLTEAEFEPDCWRSYAAEFGNSILKPDLYAVTVTDRFEDHWFFEVDRATEALIRIKLKCESYCRYFYLGAEQKRTGVFPRVAWIAPTAKRRDSIHRYINENLGDCTELFVVVTFGELEALIRGGKEVACK